MELWRRVFREGFCPQLSTPGLEALRQALLSDDERLLQGATTSPPPMACALDWPVEGACAVSLCGWQGDGIGTVGELEEYFGRVCVACDEVGGEPAWGRFFLNHFDEVPREQMRSELLEEVELELQRRKACQQPPVGLAG